MSGDDVTTHLKCQERVEQGALLTIEEAIDERVAGEGYRACSIKLSATGVGNI